MFFYLKKIFSKLSLYTFFLFIALLITGNFYFSLLLFASLFKGLSLTFKHEEEMENNVTFNNESVQNNGKNERYYYYNYSENLSKNKPLVRKRVKKIKNIILFLFLI